MKTRNAELPLLESATKISKSALTLDSASFCTLCYITLAFRIKRSKRKSLFYLILRGREKEMHSTPALVDRRQGKLYRHALPRTTSLPGANLFSLSLVHKQPFFPAKLATERKKKMRKTVALTPAENSLLRVLFLFLISPAGEEGENTR